VVVEGNRLTLQPTSINSMASFDEFDDIELTETALMSVAGGKGRSGSAC